MRWTVGRLYTLMQTGVDETYKPICTPVYTGIAHFRVLPWKPAHYEIDGNDLDKVTRTFFTKKKPDELTDVKSIVLQGYSWTVEHIAHFSDGAAVVAYRSKPVGATGSTGVTGSTGATGRTAVG